MRKGWILELRVLDLGNVRVGFVRCGVCVCIFSFGRLSWEGFGCGIVVLARWLKSKDGFYNFDAGGERRFEVNERFGCERAVCFQKYLGLLF